MILTSLNSACRAKLMPLSRVTEVLESAEQISRAAGVQDFQSFCQLRPALQLLSKKAIDCIEGSILENEDTEASSKYMAGSVKLVVDLRSNLGGAQADFDIEFFRRFKTWFDEMTTERNEKHVLRSGLITEWAIAYSQQLDMSLPDWMMNKDEVEALRKLQAAVESKDEKLLREAVIFAKQARAAKGSESDHRLTSLYTIAVDQLRLLKRMPSGWEVTELVGRDATAKMFRQAEQDSPELKDKIQQLMKSTAFFIRTQDRKGEMPKGYRVDRVISVQNAESWVSYLKCTERIADQCKHYPGAAPCTDEAWRHMSGKIESSRLGQEILECARYPKLSENANEFLMFHGTKPAAADSIAMNHFDMSFASKEGLFGAGLYFAESSSKGDEYVQPDAHNRFPIILCRVALGRINYCDSKLPAIDPGREKLQDSCKFGEFHSVLGDRKKVKNTYREFVVYDHFQVYPHFIVWYTRLFD